MARPGTRFFIGPLTPAQQARRQRSRQTFQHAAEIADARCISMRDALLVATGKHYGEPWCRGGSLLLTKP